MFFFFLFYVHVVGSNLRYAGLFVLTVRKFSLRLMRRGEKEMIDRGGGGGTKRERERKVERRIQRERGRERERGGGRREKKGKKR